MYRASIAVLDATRARIFAFERSSEPEGLQERFVEQADLVNPSRRRRPSELFSDTRPGSNRVGGRGHAFDDHRDDHIDQFDAAFARDIAAALGESLRDPTVKRLIVCAPPKMLGMFRDAVRGLQREGLVVDELARDLAKLSAPELREHLTGAGLLPARVTGRPEFATTRAG